jgi:hypothetical protein
MFHHQKLLHLHTKKNKEQPSTSQNFFSNLIDAIVNILFNKLAQVPTMNKGQNKRSFLMQRCKHVKPFSHKKNPNQ